MLLESSFSALFQSAVAAFPNTTRRQHVTGPIQISEFSWLPFIGVKTLFVRSTATNEDRQYRPMILFKNVNYSPEENVVTLTVDNQQVNFEQLGGNDVLVRCNCNDFYWRFNYYNHLDHSLYSRKRVRYDATTDRGPINPTESPGLCKHLMKMGEILTNNGIVSDI